jgi:hypothetical protein
VKKKDPEAMKKGSRGHEKKKPKSLRKKKVMVDVGRGKYVRRWKERWIRGAQKRRVKHGEDEMEIKVMCPLENPESVKGEETKG